MMKRCPTCTLYVRPDSIKCPHCGVYLSRSLEGMVRPDPAILLHRPFAARGGQRPDPGMALRRRMRATAALLAIAAIFVATWKLTKDNADPAANPLPVTFEEFQRVFGSSSDLTPEQKERTFDRYRGKYVRWEGTIVYLNTAEEPEPHVSISQGKDISPDADVTLYVRPKDRDRLGDLRVGDRVSYLGSLADYGMDGAPVIVQDGRIVTK